MKRTHTHTHAHICCCCCIDKRAAMECVWEGDGALAEGRGRHVLTDINTHTHFHACTNIHTCTAIAEQTHKYRNIKFAQHTLTGEHSHTDRNTRTQIHAGKRENRLKNEISFSDSFAIFSVQQYLFVCLLWF